MKEQVLEINGSRIHFSPGYFDSEGGPRPGQRAGKQHGR